MLGFFSGSFENIGIFHVFQPSFDGGLHQSITDRYIKYVKNAHIFKTTTQTKKINTLHNLITFSIVFTNGGGVDSNHQN